MEMPGKERMRSMVEEWPCGARMVSCKEQPASRQEERAGRRNQGRLPWFWPMWLLCGGS